MCACMCVFDRACMCVWGGGCECMDVYVWVVGVHVCVGEGRAGAWV